MAQSFLNDENILLRAPEPNDLDIIYIWENDSSLWNAGNAVAPYSHKQIWNYINEYDADIFKSRQLKFIISDKHTSDNLGTIDIFDFDPINRHASIGILIDQAYRRNGYAKRAITLLCEYCRSHLGIHSLTSIVEKDNTASINTFKSCGFATCGCLRSWIRRANSFSDAVIMQIVFQ